MGTAGQRWGRTLTSTAANTPVANRTPKQRRVHHRYQCALRDVQPLQFAVDVNTPDDIRRWIEEWSRNPIGMPRAIREEDQGRLNEDDLDIWLWYRSIVPKTHDSLFERIVWRDIFLILGRFTTLAGNHERLTPLLARLRDCPAGRCWAWPNDTTPNAVPLECITHWLWTSAGVTTDRAQCWLEPYAQCLESGQWHSRTALEACARAVAKLAQPHKAMPGGGTGATMPRSSNTHFNMAPILGAIVFPPVPNLGIRTLTQDDDVIMENTTTVPQASSAHATATVSLTSSVHDTVPVPSALTVYATAMVPQALSVNAAATVPQASSVNTAAMVLKASSAYDTAPVPLALSVSATATVSQALSITAASMVPQPSSANAGVMVPLAMSATTSTSMDVNAPHAPVDDTTEAEERATAEIYA